MSAKAREQSATVADPACHDLLLEKLPSFVPAVYSDDKAFVISRIMLFHTRWKKKPSPSGLGFS
jgi:hypothetical protein